MSAQIIPIASVRSEDQAWDAYVEKAKLLADNPKLLLDRSFNEDLALRHERWRRLFLFNEGVRR